MSVKFALYDPDQMTSELWLAYAALRDARAIYDDPFFDPDFARLVAEVRCDTRFGFATEADEVIGVWALHLRPGNWARPIGGPFSDWHGPILKQGTGLSAESFLAGLDISGMTTFAMMPQEAGLLSGLTRTGANITDLSMGWDAFIQQQQKLWPKHFKKMRRLYRNVERDFSGHTFNWDDTTDASYQRLIALKRDQFARTGYHDVLKPEWVRALLDRLRAYQGPRLRLRLVSLFLDDAHAASELNLQSDKVLHGWLTGFERELGQYSPGNMLVQDMLPHMPSEGLLIYDAGPGLDHYKRHYANLQVPIDSGTLRGRDTSFAPTRMAGRAWRWGEQHMPTKAGEIMKRARRRMDQISLTETDLGGRMSGVINAISQRDL